MSDTTLAILVVLALAALVPGAMLGLSAVLGPNRPDRNKLEPFEAGLPVVVGGARDRFSVKFYLVAILFIVFDVETAFLYPWAVNFRVLGAFGFVEMLVFIAVLLVGYVYVIRKGALSWD